MSRLVFLRGTILTLAAAIVIRGPSCARNPVTRMRKLTLIPHNDEIALGWQTGPVVMN